MPPEEEGSAEAEQGAEQEPSPTSESDVSSAAPAATTGGIPARKTPEILAVDDEERIL